MKTSVVLFSILFLAGSSLAHSSKEKVPASESNRAEDLVSPFYSVDSSVKEVLDKAYAYAVYPSVGEGGAVLGGAYGKGLVYKKGLLRDSLVGKSELVSMTIGLQLGGKSYSELVLFKNEKTFNEFKKGNIQLDAKASAVALKKGAASTARYNKGIVVFTLAQEGLMGQLSVGGQKLSFVPAEKE